MKPSLGKSSDKRLGIEIAALRQQLWRKPGDTDLDLRVRDKRPTECTDMIRWIDTRSMLADPLTKDMRDDYLQNVLDTNEWDFEQKQLDKDEKDKKKAYRHAKRHGLLPGSGEPQQGPEHIRIDTDAEYQDEGDETEVEKEIVRHSAWYNLTARDGAEYYSTTSGATRADEMRTPPPPPRMNPTWPEAGADPAGLQYEPWSLWQ